MNASEWVAAFAKQLGVAPPDPKTVETLLAVAAEAAHSSERTAAPIACYLTGATATDPAEALRLATEIGST